jgi:uncharacterized membrane protein
MIDKEDAALLARITGIALSIFSAVILFIKPFEYVTNTLLVYILLISAALFVMIGQLITIRLNQPDDFPNQHKRHEATYDALTIGFVMILFIGFYVIPFIQKYTTLLS